MRFRVVAALTLVFVLLGSPVTASFTGGVPTNQGGNVLVPGGDTGQQADGVASATATQTSQPSRVLAADDQRTTIAIDLQANGDARWTVTLARQLDSENETAAFKVLAERWVNGTSTVEFSVAPFREFAGHARNATGRTMRVPRQSVTRGWELANETGRLQLSFTWTNFARRADGQLVVDDAFDTPTGTWLPRLEADQRLVIEPPEGYSPNNSPPGPRLVDGTLIWQGPVTFGTDYFTIVYSADETPSGTPASTTPRSATTDPGGSTTPPPGDGLSQGLLFGIAAAILVGGAMALYRVRSGPRTGGSGGPGTDAGTDSGPGDDPGASADDPGASTDASAASAGSDGDGADPEPAADPEPTPEDPFAGVDPDLLSDEERVLRLLEANGGRMKQGTIVKETGWSNAKVSQLLSGMDEDDEIDKLRIGRENLISLPDVDVQDFNR